MLSEECLYEYTKCCEILIMNVTSKNKSGKNVNIYIYIYWEKKIKKKIRREYGLNHYRNLSEKEEEKKEYGRNCHKIFFQWWKKKNSENMHKNYCKKLKAKSIFISIKDQNVL